LDDSLTRTQVNIREDPFTHRILGFFAALVAGYSGYLFAGNLGLEGKAPFGKVWVRASGAFAAFIIVFIVFNFIETPESNSVEPTTDDAVAELLFDASSLTDLSYGEEILIDQESTEEKR
jgi:hypothetical protein